MERQLNLSKLFNILQKPADKHNKIKSSSGSQSYLDDNLSACSA
jgi:hypothetical protein